MRIRLYFITLIFMLLIGCASTTDNLNKSSSNDFGGETSTTPANVSDEVINEVTNTSDSVDESVGQGDGITQILTGTLTVHYIDVGQGAAQLIIGPTGKVMLIDGGNNDDEQLMVEYLTKKQIDRVDILIGTHPDADHVGGLDAVIDNFEIGSIYMPRIQANTKTFEDVLLAIQRKGLKVNTAKAGLVLDFEESTIVNMIGPVNDYDDRNEMSAVVHLTFGDTAFLFTGDAESQSEQDLLQSGTDLKADVLLVGHHGSNSSTTEAFLDAVSPTYAVIQSGADNSYGHPHHEVLNRLTEKSVQIYRNDLQGNVIFTSDGQTIDVNVDDWKPSVDEAAEREQSTPDPSPTPPLSQINEEVGELSVAASIDNATPKQNSTVTVTVSVTDQTGKPVNGAEVNISLKYKSTKTVYEGTTDANGNAVISFKIGRAAEGYEVVGDITVTFKGKTAKTTTSFTPQ